MGLISFCQAKGTAASSLWRGMLAVSPFLEDGIGWTVGRGDRIRFWLDNWLEGYGPLISHTFLSPDDVDFSWKITDVCRDGCWNIESTLPSLLSLSMLFLLPY